MRVVLDANVFVSAALKPGSKPAKIIDLADFIVSGDRRLTDLKVFRGIKIIDPASFLELIGKE